MAKIQIKSDKITPFGGIFPIMDEFDRVLSGIVDSTLGFRCRLFGYQYSEIIRSLMCVYFCGGTCIEDITKHLMPYVSQHPKLRTCSSDIKRHDGTGDIDDASHHHRIVKAGVLAKHRVLQVPPYLLDTTSPSTT